LPRCQGVADTWDAGYGACPNYAIVTFAPYCSLDYDAFQGLFAAEACSECGQCRCCAPCRGDPGTWNSGYGFCSSYAPGDVNAG
jgi:hypothetical protein